MQSSQRQWEYRTADVRFETPQAKLDNHAYALQTYSLLVHCGNAVFARAPDGADIPANTVRLEADAGALFNPAVSPWL